MSGMNQHWRLDGHLPLYIAFTYIVNYMSGMNQQWRLDGHLPLYIAFTYIVNYMSGMNQHWRLDGHLPLYIAITYIVNYYVWHEPALATRWSPSLIYRYHIYSKLLCLA